jgi:hypothetical protein
MADLRAYVFSIISALPFLDIIPEMKMLLFVAFRTALFGIDLESLDRTIRPVQIRR